MKLVLTIPGLVARRVVAPLLTGSLLLACRDELTRPPQQPRAAAHGLLQLAPTDMSGPIVQLPWVPGFGNQAPVAFDINDRGDVVGASWTVLRSDGAWDDTYRAIIWPGDGGPPRVLPPLGGVDIPGESHSEASDINDRGDVVGMSWSEDDRLYRVTLWPGDGGLPRELMPLGGFANRAFHDGPEGNGALDINDRGDVVGMSRGRPTLWLAADEKPRDLGSGVVRAINNRGHIIVGDRLLFRDGRPPRVLPPLDGYSRSVPSDVNDREEVVGWSESADGSFRATLWPADGSSPRDLGTLSAEYPNSQASEISDRGDIVGTSRRGSGSPRATLWPADRGPPVDLGVLSAGLWSLGASINNAGSAVGHGGSPTGYPDLDYGPDGPRWPVAIRWAPFVSSAPRVWPPAAIARSTDAGACSAAAVELGTPTVYGDASGVTVSGARDDDQPFAAPYPRGLTTITWTATDAENRVATVTQTVTVSDREPPTVTAPRSVTVPTAQGLATATVEVGAASGADNCEGVTVIGTRGDAAALTAPYPVGTTSVTWKATDGSGNSTSAVQTITVTDGEAPTLSVPNVAIDATTRNGALVQYRATASDNVGVASLSCAPESETWFPIGVSEVSCTVADAAANTVVQGFTVTVRGASDQISRLRAYVRGVLPPSPFLTQLLDILRRTQGELSQAVAACGDLDLFLSNVSANTGTLMSPDQARRMSADALRIQAVLECGPLIDVGRLSGVVTDAALSLGIRGATVAVTGGPVYAFRQTVTTDESGRYDIQGLKHGTYTVTAAASGFAAEGQQTAAVASTTVEVNFVMQPASSLSGVVRIAGTDGRIAGATVTVTGGPLSGFRRIMTTNEAGRYELGGLSPGTYAVAATAPGFSQATQAGVQVVGAREVNVGLQRDLPQTLVLSPSSLISGEIGLSMQDNTSIQLRAWPAGVPVVWSSSDPTGDVASVSSTGLVTVRQGNDDKKKANEVVVLATGSGAWGRVRINSFSFSHWPRALVLVWRPIPGARWYEAIVDYCGGTYKDLASDGVGLLPTQCTNWRRYASPHASRTWVGIDFDGVLHGGSSWVGRRAGRWRVVAKDDAMNVIAAPSEWVYFNVVR